MNTTQAQQKALVDALVALADHLEFGKCNMRLKIRHQTKRSYISSGQKFEDLPLEHDILSFIRDLGHSRDIIYLTDVNVNYLHQPWREFATVINKCLSGKETGMDKIRLSQNKEAKKTNKMSYPRFTKIIIDCLMSKDQFISRRNKMFWHTDRDDTVFTSMRCISRHEDTQVYGTILPKELTNQAMLESKAYQTYYAFASGEKAPKPKYIRKKANSDTSSKKKPVQATKGTRLKTSAKSKVPDKQQEKVTGTNKGASVTPEVPNVPKYDSESKEESWTFSQDDEDAEEESDLNDDSEETESDNDGDDLTHPNLSTYKADEDDEEEEKADDEEVSSDQRVSTSPDYELTEEEKYKEDDDKDKEGEQEEEKDDLYRDLNINLERSDAEMTNAQAYQDIKDTHVTLITMPPVVQQQSSYVSSELVSKFINPSPDTSIDSFLNQDTQTDTLVNVLVLVAAETPSSITTIPQPPIPNIQPLQQTPTSTTTTTNQIMTLLEIPNFASLFQFDQRVSALESEMFEFRQTSQFAEAVSSIPGIVDTYLASKMKEAVDVVVQLQINKLSEEAHAENQEFLNQIDSTMQEIIKEQVQSQVSKIMPKIEKYVTESLGAEVFVRSTNQPQKTYAVAASLQNRRDLPRDIPLDSVVVLRYEKRSKSKNKGKVPTKMELVLEQTQQGTSYEISVSTEGVEELKEKLRYRVKSKKPSLHLGRNRVNTYAVKNHKDDC
ncbi:hypothetical protein Tco_1362226 [Tanacetum coccineum]